MKIESGKKINDVITAFLEKEVLCEKVPIMQYKKAFIDALGAAIKDKYQVIQPKSEQILPTEFKKQIKERTVELKNFTEMLIKKNDPNAYSILNYFLLPLAVLYIPYFLLKVVPELESEERESWNNFYAGIEPEESEYDKRRRIYSLYVSLQKEFLKLNEAEFESSHFDMFVKKYLPYFQDSKKAAMVFDLYVRCKNIKNVKQIIAFKQHYQDLCEHKLLPSSTIFMNKIIVNQRTSGAIIDAYMCAENIDLTCNNSFVEKCKCILIDGVSKRLYKILDEMMSYVEERDVLIEDKKMIESIERGGWNLQGLTEYIVKYQDFNFNQDVSKLLAIINSIQVDGKNNDLLIKPLMESVEDFLNEEIKINKEFAQEKFRKLKDISEESENSKLRKLSIYEEFRREHQKDNTSKVIMQSPKEKPSM